MNDSPTDILLVELARVTITNVAPDELPLFGLFAEARRDPPAARRSDPLAFGIETATVFTPYVFSVLAPVVEYLVSQTVDALKIDASAAIQGWVHKVMRRGKIADVGTGTITLDPAQLDAVRDAVLKSATRLRLPPPRAKLLADAVVGSLV